MILLTVLSAYAYLEFKWGKRKIPLLTLFKNFDIIDIFVSIENNLIYVTRFLLLNKASCEYFYHILC